MKKDIAEKIFEKYGLKKGKEIEELPSAEALSREYKMFLERLKPSGAKLYEKMCLAAGKMLRIKPSKKEGEELQLNIDLIGFNITPGDVISLSILFLIFPILIGIILLVFTFNPIFLIVPLSSFGLYYYVRSYPKRNLETRRAKASGELILAILYIVIYMRNVSNIEGAIKFASDNLEGPLALEFKKLLWDTQAKKYSTVGEGIANYVKEWREYNPVFVDSLYLIEASLFQRTEQDRIKVLDKALEVMLEGTYEAMVRYSAGLKQPLDMIYMLGIMLPVLGLVMFPIIGSFMAEVVNPISLAVLYNVVLPVVVIFFAMEVLKKRPAGFPIPEISKHPDVPPPGCFYIGKGKRRIALKAAIPAIIVFFIFLIPAVSLLSGATVEPKEQDIYYSMLITGGVCTSLIVYNYLLAFQRIKIRQTVWDLEKEFSEGTFQLGSRLGEGMPLELSFKKVAGIMKGSRTSDFFKKICDNISQLGMDLRRAIFDEKNGAIQMFPSPVVRSTMMILSQSAKKSVDVAAVSMIHISRYLKNIHIIEEKISDMLSDTLSSMKFQATFLAPIISGLVVGLTAMILIIIFSLNVQIEQISAMGEESTEAGISAIGPWVLGIFQMSSTVPLYIFQPVVGIYLIEIILLLVWLISEVESRGDKIYRLFNTTKILPIGAVLYIICTVVVTIMFTGIAKFALVATKGM